MSTTADSRIIRARENITGRTLHPARQPARVGDIRHSLGSPLGAQQRLGFRSAGSLDEGLRAFLA